jgi:predicted nucleotidyltransferase
MRHLHECQLAPQHRALIERASTRFASDPNVLALIVGGSVAHGYAQPGSDVDVLVVLEEDAATARHARGEFTINDSELADYDGGYLDGKLISRSFIEG